MKNKVIRVAGAYGMELILPNKIGEQAKPHSVERMPAGHRLDDCGRHYNIFEPDEGFPQDRFFKNSRRKSEEGDK